MHESEIVNVYLAGTLVEAEFLRNVVSDAGIESRVVGAGSVMAGMLPHEEHTPCLWVHRSDESRARQLLADFEKNRARPRSESEPSETWKCAACGELVDDDFELCWNCQNPRKPY
jgi:rubrerythrin